MFPTSGRRQITAVIGVVLICSWPCSLGAQTAARTMWHPEPAFTIDDVPPDVIKDLQRLGLGIDHLRSFKVDRMAWTNELNKVQVGETHVVEVPIGSEQLSVRVERLPIETIPGDDVRTDYRRFRGQPIGNEAFVEVRIAVWRQRFEIVVITDDGLEISDDSGPRIFVMDAPLVAVPAAEWCRSTEELMPGSLQRLQVDTSPRVLTPYDLRIALVPSHRYWVTPIGLDLDRALWISLRAVNAAAGVFRRDVNVELTPYISSSLVPLQSVAWKKAKIEAERFEALQAYLDHKIGRTNYEIGHLFREGEGGTGKFRSACSEQQSRGETGWDHAANMRIASLVHELSHQMNAHHSYNGKCSGRDPNGAFEPGAGNTLMGFLPCCMANQPKKLPFLHEQNVMEAVEYLRLACARRAETPGLTGVPSITLAAAPAVALLESPVVMHGVAKDPNDPKIRARWTERRVQPAKLDQSPPAFLSEPGKAIARREFPTPRQAAVPLTAASTVEMIATVRDGAGGFAASTVAVPVSTVKKLTLQLPAAVWVGVPFDLKWATTGSKDQDYRRAPVDIEMSVDDKPFEIVRSKITNDGKAKVCFKEATTKAVLRVSASAGGFAFTTAPFTVTPKAGSSCP